MLATPPAAINVGSIRHVTRFCHCGALAVLQTEVATDARPKITEDRTMIYSHTMQPFPIRVRNGDWQVLTKRNHRTNSENYRQANILSHSTQLLNDAATSRRNGAAFS